MQNYKPDLKQFMSVCAANYAKVLRLLADDNKPATMEYSLDNKTELVFKLIETAPYTDTYKLKQKGSLKLLTEDICTFRVYHDAKVAEVIASSHPMMLPPIYSYPNKEMNMPDEKMQINRFLGQWLSFCLQFGQSHSKNKTCLAFLSP